MYDFLIWHFALKPKYRYNVVCKVKPLPTPTLQVEERSITLRRETGYQTLVCKGEKGISC